MNNKLVLILYKCLVLAILFSSISSEPQDGDEIDGIAAVVGDQIILKSEVAQLIQMAALDLQLDPILDEDKLLLLKDQMLDNLINQKIILEIAEVESIEVKESDIDRALDNQINSMIARLGSEERVEQAFGKTIKQIKREYWPEMQNQIVSEQFQGILMRDITVTRKEVIDFYEQYRDSLGHFPEMYNMSHILIPVTPGSKSKKEAYNLLSSLRNEIINENKLFEEVAREHSNDPGSAKHGGKLGLVGRGTFVPEFEATAFTLKESDISNIVSTEFGYHLIELIEKIGEKISVRHILITPKISDVDEDSVYQFVLVLRDSIMSGISFSALAKKHTKDETSKSAGGRLGWVNPKSLSVPEIPQILPSLEVGVVSPPIRASDGYHLILVHGIKEAGVPTLKTHWTEIENIALSKKQSDFFSNWIDNSKSSVFIKIMN